MNVYKVVLKIVNHDGLSESDIETVIEDGNYPNDCIGPVVVSIESRDIGEWRDSHPLNSGANNQEAFWKLFEADPSQSDALKSWQSAALIATGGHATTPELLIEVVAGLRKALDEAKGENERLRTIVEKLPTTADGVRVVPGDDQVFRWNRFKNRVVAYEVFTNTWCFDRCECPECEYIDVDDVGAYYSTQAAALAAKEGK